MLKIWTIKCKMATVQQAYDNDMNDNTDNNVTYGEVNSDNTIEQS